jgi:secreted PhoX family phosphatase
MSRTLTGWAAAAAFACATVTFANAIQAEEHDAEATFVPLGPSAPCYAGGAGAYPNEQPFILPPGYTQHVFAREGDGGTTDNWDMNVLNETGPHAGRYLFRSHETPENGQLSVTDLWTGDTHVVVARHDWNRMDGLVWTPWRTLLIAEEMRPERLPSTPDPLVPQAQAGLVYEVDPETGAVEPRPALGAKAHEGIRIDPQGNVYAISETAPSTRVGTPPRPAPGGYIFKFVPDRRGDLSSGQLYALKIVVDEGDRTGEAIWIPLDRDLVQIDADAAATQAGATGYGRPEDVEIATSTGSNHGGALVLYVAVTDESRVLRVDLREPAGGPEHATAFVSDYVRRGVNAPDDFTNVDNLALDKAGNLFITEDTATPPGMDIWVAFPGRGDALSASRTVKFASLTDCEAEPSGIYFDRSGSTLFVNVLHRGGPDRRDLGVMITREH